MVGFILRSLIHLDLSFLHGDRYGSICILLYVDIQLCQHHLLKMLSFFHCIILASLSKIRCSILLVNPSVFMTIPSFLYSSSIIELVVRNGDAPGSSFIMKDSFGYPVLFLYMKLSIILSRSIKNCVGILMGIALSL